MGMYAFKRVDGCYCQVGWWQLEDLSVAVPQTAVFYSLMHLIPIYWFL
jgi:hypothetical protein